MLSGRPQTWRVSIFALGSLHEDTVRVTADSSHLYRDGHDGLSAASSTPCGAIGVTFMIHYVSVALALPDCISELEPTSYSFWARECYSSIPRKDTST